MGFGSGGDEPHFGGDNGQLSVAIAILFTSPSGAALSWQPHSRQCGFFFSA